MLEVEGIGSEIITAFFVGALSAALLAIFVSAWRLTGRRPLFYDLFLVEIHSLDARRFVQVLQLGQEFRPLGSWSDVMARIRSRARSQVQPNDTASGSSTAVFDTNVVIQSPATVMDDSAATTPPPSSSTLWEIEMPVATPSGEGNDVSHESHFAAAAAIAVLGRGGFQVASSETVDIVPGGPGVSVSSVSAVGDESNSNSVTRIVARRHQRYTGIVMPMNISVVTDEPGIRQDTPSVSGQSEPSPSTSEDVTQSEEPALSTGSNDDVENRDSTGGENPESANAEIEGDSVIRLKFLDDTQRDARTTMTDTIGKFKSVHFGEAVAAGRVVRLIYQGQLLREDSRTLASYGLRDGCVVHCHISNTPYSRQAPSQPAASSTGLRHRESATNNVAAPAPNAGADLLDFRYPRWAVALLLNTYRFPIIGLPLDAIIRFIFDRQSQEPSTEPGIIRRTYQRFHSTVFGTAADNVSHLDRAAEAAARPLPQRLCLGDYLVWIFAGQFAAVWAFVYAFPQLCDRTALGLLVLLTLYFFFVVCRSRDGVVAAPSRGRDNPVVEPTTNSER
ncbi:unnamed protein product [Nippostrongylus brasiliensis]|uniref:Ubiquitin-like domain-containing protein n=1 Tax=Nippostrongylus brasiliensis TaxID=27835 RepID=A0A0N4XYM5_NIPBR|nr:unnamed protein product [Nippostrongylus brasiliensis]